MNKGIIVQFIFLLAALLVWNCLPLGYSYQKEVYGRELEQRQIILISESSSTLDSLASRLSELDYVASTKIEADTLITNKLITVYGLEEARSILSKYDLPDVMQIFVRGSSFDLKNFNDLERILETEFPDLNYNYNSDKLLEIEAKKILILKTYYIFNGLIILFLLLAVTFIRIHFETGKNTFWKIFRETGGHSKRRNRQFWLNSLLLSAGPLLIIILVYYVLRYANILIYEIDPYLFGVEFITLLISVLITRIFLGARY